jgi:hypothetical protein
MYFGGGCILAVDVFWRWIFEFGSFAARRGNFGGMNFWRGNFRREIFKEGELGWWNF